MKRLFFLHFFFSLIDKLFFLLLINFWDLINIPTGKEISLLVKLGLLSLGGLKQPNFSWLFTKHMFQMRLLIKFGSVEKPKVFFICYHLRLKYIKLKQKKLIYIYIYIWGINKTIWFVFNKLKEKNIVEMREKKLKRERERERERRTYKGYMVRHDGLCPWYKPLVATFLFIITLK